MNYNVLDIFTFDSYKEFLRAYIKANKRPGLIAELASAAQCDRSYMSQALNSKIQLTPDHALALADYFRFEPKAEAFFLLLVLRERAATLTAKQKMSKRIQLERAAHLTVSERVKNVNKAGELSHEQKEIYYSSWHYSAVHVLTRVKEFQSLEAIAQNLNLSQKKTAEILAKLGDMRLVKRNGPRWEHVSGDLHIPRGSVYNMNNHLNWRMRAVEQSNTAESLHYTNILSCSAKDAEHLKRMLLDYISEQRKIVKDSADENLYCFCCDFFSPE
jgi:uncharacterized protein (TIGR02147 family)